MKTERQSKIGHLSRVSRGKMILSSYLSALSSATESEVTVSMLTELQERDLLLEVFRTGYRESKATGANAFSKTYAAEDKGTVFANIACFAIRLDEPAFLLTKDSETCGAVQMNGCLMLRHCEALLEIDGEAVVVLSKDHSDGLLLDYFPDETEFRYELTVWGSTWPLLMMKCAESSAHDAQLD